jgi:hypothetical protein
MTAFKHKTFSTSSKHMTELLGFRTKGQHSLPAALGFSKKGWHMYLFPQSKQNKALSITHSLQFLARQVLITLSLLA